MVKYLVCRNCKQNKPITDFYRSNTTRRGYRTQCKECIKPKSKILQARRYKIRKQEGYYDKFDRIDRKKREIKQKYGLTLEDYYLILEKQNGKCAICNGENNVKYKDEKETFFCIDHNHLTGDIRGLLCTKCNVALGLFKDNIDILLNAIRYLNKYKEGD